MERKALDDARHLNIIDLLFPLNYQHIVNRELKLPQYVILRNWFELRSKLISNNWNRLQFFDPKIKSDVNQIAAVKHIVAGTSYPLPYLLIGFPGTGKTKVIVESICQLFTNSKNRILVCASSNNVCDEIAQKLIPLLKTTCQYQTPLTQQYNILRLYGSTNVENLLVTKSFSPCVISDTPHQFDVRVRAMNCWIIRISMKNRFRVWRKFTSIALLCVH